MQFDLTQATKVLAATPDVARALLATKSADWLNARKAREAFSPLDVLGHLIEGEKTDWIPRVRILLEHGEGKAFEPFDRFAFRSWIAGKSVNELLHEFAALRGQNLAALRKFELQDAQLELRGCHPELGAVTLENLLATWVVHDLNHIAQMVQAMASEYRDAVGPWRPYLSILK